MFQQTETCNFRCFLRVLLICTGLFFFFSLLNLVGLGGFFRFKYNTTYECIRENVTHCFNDPDNLIILEWAIGLALVFVLIGLLLFIIYLTVQYIKKRRTTYEIVTNLSAQEELVYTVNAADSVVIQSDSDSDSHSLHERERSKKED